jgi:hypothetical protein
VTSPFKLLAGAFGGGSGDAKGGGDDLAFVEFEPGRSEVTASGQKKMEALAKALQDRPALKLEIVARVDSQKDVAALKAAALQRALAADGKAPKGSEAAAIDPADYPRLVKAAFVREKLPRPEEKGVPREPTLPEMEAMLLERIVVGDEELRALSLRRAEGARDFLVQKGGLGAERVSIGTSAEAPAESKARASRVDFALR